ncbi:hypothetical protein TH61_02495 [Rufibacter sp. DG15C]|uniref:hypothetical protein n=1 Tax=Rufibacter sp. DG15C TaxID=1379909 RepID=UPI00078ECCBE|nr:hypothetical protein [Rufibacter sp. DG15C]AMM50275.1 hypothetical protein TH61_02495 [Rufibacter sp. DG15C]
MKNLSLLCLFAVALMAAKCGSGPNFPKEVYGKTWLYSYEEDSADVRTYRPNTFDFPASRGRTGFMIKEDGTFINYAIAPTDGLEEQPGKWTAQSKNVITVELEGAPGKLHTIEVLSGTPTVLKIKRKSSEDQ